MIKNVPEHIVNNFIKQTKNAMRKSLRRNILNPSDFTEIRNEVVIASDGYTSYKELRAIFSMVKGIPKIRYAVYYGVLCVMCTESLSMACNKYNSEIITNVPSSMAEDMVGT